MIFYTRVCACVSFGCVSFSIYMGSLNHSHVHTTYSFNPIPLPASPTTGTPPPFLPPQLPRLLLPRTMPTAKYARACLKKIKCSFVTYATQDGTWTASSHPSPPSQWDLECSLRGQGRPPHMMNKTFVFCSPSCSDHLRFCCFASSFWYPPCP